MCPSPEVQECVCSTHLTHLVVIKLHVGEVHESEICVFFVNLICKRSKENSKYVILADCI